jgi:hypothetical protein
MFNRALTYTLIAMLIATALACSAPAAWAQQGDVSWPWQFNNHTDRIVEVRLHSTMRANWTWPGGDKVFEVAPASGLKYWVQSYRDEQICWSISYRNAPTDIPPHARYENRTGLNMDGTGTCTGCCQTYSLMNTPDAFPIHGPGFDFEP